MYAFNKLVFQSQGREEGAVIDSWEDPDLPLYHFTDRYGFIQLVVFLNLTFYPDFLRYYVGVDVGLHL